MTGGRCTKNGSGPVRCTTDPTRIRITSQPAPVPCSATSCKASRPGQPFWNRLSGVFPDPADISSLPEVIIFHAFAPPNNPIQGDVTHLMETYRVPGRSELLVLCCILSLLNAFAARWQVTYYPAEFLSPVSKPNTRANQHSLNIPHHCLSSFTRLVFTPSRNAGRAARQSCRGIIMTKAALWKCL